MKRKNYPDRCWLTIFNLDGTADLNVMERTDVDGDVEVALTWDCYCSGAGEIRFTRRQAHKVARAMLQIPARR